eukprot:scaffold6918_cov380-Prasinococcus_capsulatus_cf.AAC.17
MQVVAPRSPAAARATATAAAASASTTCPPCCRRCPPCSASSAASWSPARPSTRPSAASRMRTALSPPALTVERRLVCCGQRGSAGGVPRQAAHD